MGDSTVTWTALVYPALRLIFVVVVVTIWSMYFASSFDGTERKMIIAVFVSYGLGETAGVVGKAWKHRG